MGSADRGSFRCATRAGAIWARRRLARTLCLALAGGVLAACGVPEHMLVDKGSYPQSIDKDVRFRTNYYFRIFDYCWNKNTDERAYIPETDTLYRYRMTGKSHSLLSKVKFESGILDASVIDPFGTDVVYDGNINGFRLRTAEEAKQESRNIEAAKERAAEAQAREATRATALARFEQLRTAYEALEAPPADASPERKAAAQKVREQLEVAMQRALTAYVSDLAVALPEPDKNAIDALSAEIKELAKKLPGGQQPPASDSLQEAVTAVDKHIKSVEDKLAGLTKVVEGKTALEEVCPADKPTVRRGFQVMGPEGWKTFNQDERLVMAMSTSASPLIETLQEYAGRVLQSRYNPADALLPLVRENLVTVQAQQAAERQDPAAAPVDDIFAKAIASFGGT